MSTIIKAGEQNVHSVAFNFDDMAVKAGQYLDKVRAEAAQILAKTRQEAVAIRQKAEEEGRKQAQATVEKMVEQRAQELVADNSNLGRRYSSLQDLHIAADLAIALGTQRGPRGGRHRRPGSSPRLSRSPRSR